MPANDVDTSDAAVAATAAAERRLEDDGPADGEGAVRRAYVRRIFSEIAPRYDLLNHLLSFNVDRLWRRRAITALDWRHAPVGTYLDLCAGTLDVAAGIAAQRGFRGFVVGADFAEPMLRAGAGKSPGATVQPVVADALALPIRSDAMAGVITAFGMRNVADLDAALREAHRVLTPGARCVILEFTTPRSMLVRGLYNLYFHHVLPRVGSLVSGHRTAYRYLPTSVAYFPDAETLAERMVMAGFRGVWWQTLSFGIAAIHTGFK